MQMIFTNIWYIGTIATINEKHGMIYQNNSWKLIDKNESADVIFENKRDFIFQNLNKFLIN